MLVVAEKTTTPKHIGLSSTLHQATRSKQLINLFHRAGHVLSYDDVLQIDTGLAEHTLSTMNMETGVVLPPNTVSDRFAHFSADDIDILDESLDGKNTFHATQMTVFQRCPGNELSLSSIQSSNKRLLNVPKYMEKLYTVDCPITEKPKFALNGDVL